MRDAGGLHLPALRLPGFRVRPDPEKALYYPWQSPEEEKADILLTPYFAWGNRGPGEMRVWLHADR